MSNEDALERAQSDHAHAKSELNVLKSELTTLLSDMESLKVIYFSFYIAIMVDAFEIEIWRCNKLRKRSRGKINLFTNFR